MEVVCQIRLKLSTCVSYQLSKWNKLKFPSSKLEIDLFLKQMINVGEKWVLCEEVITF